MGEPGRTRRTHPRPLRTQAPPPGEKFCFGGDILERFHDRTRYGMLTSPIDITNMIDQHGHMAPKLGRICNMSAY